jgi:hypothetical protein
MNNILFKKKTNYFLLLTYGSVLLLQIFFIVHGFSSMKDLVGKAILITLATPYILFVFIKEILFIKRGADFVLVNTQCHSVTYGETDVKLSNYVLMTAVKNISPFYTLVLDGVKLSGYYVIEHGNINIYEYPFLKFTKHK